MKKLLYAIFATALLTGCDESFDDWASPQGFEPEEAESYALSVAPASAIDMASVTTETINLFTPSLTVPEGAVLDSFYVTLTRPAENETPAVTYEVNADNSGNVNTEEFVVAVNSLYGRRPTQRTLDLSVIGYVYNADKTTMVKTIAEPVQIQVTPEAPEIAESYYIVGGPVDWAASAASKEMKFSHSGLDVYDDPVFTITFPAAEGETWFAIADEATCDAIANNEDGAWNRLFGTTNGNGNSGTSGSLARRTELSDDGSFKVESGAKYVQVTINMMDYTYEVKALNFEQFVYFIGSTNGWSDADQKLESPNFDGIYTGFVYVATDQWGSKFKFQKVAGDWDTEINYDTFTAGVSGDFGQADGNNIGITAGDGIYHVTLNLVEGTLHGTKITNMNLVGDFNKWNAADDTQQMTWDAENYCYVITGAGVTANGWKFTANNDWGINLGGDVNALTQDGSNIVQTGSTIKLYPTRKTSDNIYCTIE